MSNNQNPFEVIEPKKFTEFSLKKAFAIGTVGVASAAVAAHNNIDLVGKRPYFRDDSKSVEVTTTTIAPEIGSAVVITNPNKGGTDTSSPYKGGPLLEATTTSMLPEIGDALALTNTTIPNKGGLPSEVPTTSILPEIGDPLVITNTTIPNQGGPDASVSP